VEPQRPVLGNQKFNFWIVADDLIKRSKKEIAYSEVLDWRMFCKSEILKPAVIQLIHVLVLVDKMSHVPDAATFLSCLFIQLRRVWPTKSLTRQGIVVAGLLQVFANSTERIYPIEKLEITLLKWCHQDHQDVSCLCMRLACT